MKNLLGGLAGALALNLLHETYKRLDAKAPRVDLVGEEALSKVMEHAGYEPPAGNNLFATTLTADVISNALYYALIGAGNKKNILLRAAVLGTTAGIGALVLTKPLGLSDAPVTKSGRTKLLTIAWYLTGAMTAGVVIRALKNKR
jgi:hypothetical protein